MKRSKLTKEKYKMHGSRRKGAWSGVKSWEKNRLKILNRIQGEILIPQARSHLARLSSCEKELKKSFGPVIVVHTPLIPKVRRQRHIGFKASLVYRANSVTAKLRQ